MLCFFFQAEDGIRDIGVTGVQTCALPISTPDGFCINSCPANWPKKISVLIGPNHPRKLGNVSGVARLIRNMLIGGALLLSVMEPPSPGPHERLCFPKEICQFDHISPTYTSSNLN